MVVLLLFGLIAVGAQADAGQPPIPVARAKPAMPRVVAATGGPSIGALAYGQPSDPIGSMTETRLHYRWTGTHAVPWFGQTIEVEEEGSGVAQGPARAAYGLGVNVTKRDWLTSRVPGEIDGTNVMARNGVGDVAGHLVNVGTRAGFAAVLEGVSYAFDARGLPVRGVRTLLGVNAPETPGGDGSERGVATLADKGDNDAAFFAGRNGGTWKDFLRNEVVPGLPVTRISGSGNETDLGANQSGDVRLSIGRDRGAAGSSAIDVYGAPGSTVGLQVIRKGGAGGGSAIVHRGAGKLAIDARDAGGEVVLQAGGQDVVAVARKAVRLPQGVLTMTEVQASAVPAPAAGAQSLFIDSRDHKLKRKDATGAVTIIG
ncbi:hypothetical protein [Sphingomonas prati]|uniref:Uncharacterized protein n=1 Tax=Sphingomonas prati TaxID=1843237 RepID=A0A7W9BRS8_9SPHN|nr:hypothetical protein [Sphingomonas prati]MBB5728801.1 hypothetical protein [Sphingomonas prati]GGE87439.1 hypothetical protein GCM10011404_20310 [Sphingomonas prati]